MEHHFDIDVAKKYGIAEAVIINNFQWWIRKNKANSTHQHDGRTWTYNSQKAMTDLFPYLSRQSLRTAIKHLCDNNVIMIGDYNDNPFHKVNWYAFVDEDLWIGEFQPEHRLDNTDGLVDSNQRVVEGNQHTNNNSTNNNPTNTNPANNQRKKKKELDLSFVATEYIDAFGDWLEYKRSIGEMYKTQYGVEGAYQDLLEACGNNPTYAKEVVSYSKKKEYKGIYAPKQKQKLYGNNTSTARNPWCDVADALERAGGIL